jgi:CheY-like chemotaxis protein
MTSVLSERRVLVVEDEMMSLMMIKDLLADLGCGSVAAASTVDKAIALLDDQDFDLAMIDVNLNGAKSYAVADILSARGIPFFFSTGYREQAIEMGYDNRPVLSKPFGSAQLANMIAGVLTA